MSWVLLSTSETPAVLWEQPILQRFADADHMRVPCEEKNLIEFVLSTWLKRQGTPTGPTSNGSWEDLEQSSRKNKQCTAWGIPGGPYILLCYHLHVCVFSLAQEIQPKSSQAAFRAAKAIECCKMHTRENIIKHLDWECITSIVNIMTSTSITCNPHIASYCPSRNTADAT